MSNKYLAQGKLLHGPVTMKQPVCWQYPGDGSCPKCRYYEKHLASLPSIKADWLTDSDNGKMMELDKNFGITYRMVKGNPVIDSTYKILVPEKTTIAVPINQDKQQEGGYSSSQPSPPEQVKGFYGDNL